MVEGNFDTPVFSGMVTANLMEVENLVQDLNAAHERLKRLVLEGDAENVPWLTLKLRGNSRKLIHALFNVDYSMKEQKRWQSAKQGLVVVGDRGSAR